MNDVIDETTSHAVHLRRVFNTSIEHLFACFTDPLLVAGWWGPIGSTCPSAQADLKVGGAYRFEILGVESGDRVAVSGEYIEIDAPNRLVFTWQWEGEPDEATLVTLSFRALSGTAQQTELELVHERFANAERAALHDDGWSTSLDCLANLIANERRP